VSRFSTFFAFNTVNPDLVFNRNPWTKEIEYILCKNYLLITQQKVAVAEGSGGSLAESGDMEFFSRDVNSCMYTYHNV
jgi:hypothetical protein